MYILYFYKGSKKLLVGDKSQISESCVKLNIIIFDGWFSFHLIFLFKSYLFL